MSEKRFYLIPDPNYDSTYYVVDSKHQNKIRWPIYSVPKNIVWSDLDAVLDSVLVEKFSLKTTAELATLWEREIDLTEFSALGMHYIFNKHLDAIVKSQLTNRTGILPTNTPS